MAYVHTSDSSFQVLLSAPGNKEGATWGRVIRGGVGVSPVSAKRSEDQSPVGRKQARSGFTLLKTSLPSGLFLPVVVNFLTVKYVIRINLCYWS